MGLNNPGDPGVVGADVAAEAAWTITRGDPEVRVAVLDDGVDTSHPFLKPALVAERDFRDGDDLAAPQRDESHGTACAGIILSRDDTVRGLAPGVSLVACRIGGYIGAGWLADDFSVADAIDWCWDTAGAAVLSNSWGGGPPSDLVIQAITRARTRGRGGKGTLIVVAAGNHEDPAMVYPGDGPDILTVGASNQWDERKTRTSRDGETTWGSNSGQGLDLMAPGVQIRTTDLAGAAGSDPGPTTGRFNGTSAATPFAAAAAALVMSVRPDLTEAEVRALLTGMADSMGPTGWDPQVGFGRLNAFAALRAARRR
ncbi:S8 family serine peptidase [Paractinoplanes durhamensis]|uniref:S8 family serine peptidase n=1 Tax=Paractinoplanes durhamensis TaxID=113563 RepID=UPI003632D893